MNQDRRWKIAAWAFALALATFWFGVVMAAQFFPDAPYDWMYRVVSELASRKHNPEGGRWFSVALGFSMLALWPAASFLRDTVGDRRWPILALRAGILFGVLVGIERLTFVRFSSFVKDGHEALAVGTFAGLYTGMLGLYDSASAAAGPVRCSWPRRWPRSSSRRSSSTSTSATSAGSITAGARWASRRG